MKFIVKYFYWLILAWITIVLTFFKIYNDFLFVNNQSILFIFLLLIVPIILSIIRYIVHRQNINKIKNLKTNYPERIAQLIDKQLLDYLKTLTNLNIVSNDIYFGIDYQGLITYNDVYLEVRILNTNVSIKYYYGKTINVINTFDKVGYEHLDVKILLQDVKILVSDLLTKEVIYKETKKFNKVIDSKLYIEDTLRFSSGKKIIEKDKKKTTTTTLKL